MKRILFLLAVMIAATGVQAATNSAAPAMRPEDLFTNTIVAKGKGFEVTRAQLDQEMIYARATVAARGGSISPAQMGLVERQLLQQMIFLRALNAKATDADKTAGKESANKQFQEMLDAVSTNSALALALDARLKSVSLTREELHKQWTDRAIADAVVRRELDIKATDADVMAYYTNNPAEFETPEIVHVAHILLTTRDMETRQEYSEAKKAEKLKIVQDLLKRARSGENFSNLVVQYSEDTGKKTPSGESTGGEYTFARGRMVPEFESAAFTLSSNQVSDVVTSMYGYHIIKLLGKTPASKVELSKVHDDVKAMLEQQSILKQLPDYMKKLEKDAGVEILEPDLKNISLDEGIGASGATSPPSSPPK